MRHENESVSDRGSAVLLHLPGAGGPAAAQTARPEAAAEGMIEQAVKRRRPEGRDVDLRPWAMQDKAGNFIGFEIDVASRVARTGRQDRIHPTKWSGIIPALLTAKFDIIIGGMGILRSAPEGQLLDPL